MLADPEVAKLEAAGFAVTLGPQGAQDGGVSRIDQDTVGSGGDPVGNGIWGGHDACTA